MSGTVAELLRRPANLDGRWAEIEPDGTYRRFECGPVVVRGFEDYEPDGELVTTAPVMVHMERMGGGAWWIALSWDDDRGEVHVNLNSRKPIGVMWSAEVVPIGESVPADRLARYVG